MKKIKFKNNSEIRLSYVFKRLEIKIVSPDGVKEGVIDGSSYEIEIGGSRIKISIKELFFLFEPIVDIYENGIKSIESDTHLEHVFKDFSYLLVFFMIGNVLFMLNSYVFSFENRFFLGFLKTFAFGVQRFGSYTFLLGVFFELILLYYLKVRSRSSILFSIGLVIVDSLLSIFLFDPNIFIFSLILRGILLPKTLLSGYLAVKSSKDSFNTP